MGTQRAVVCYLSPTHCPHSQLFSLAVVSGLTEKPPCKHQLRHGLSLPETGLRPTLPPRLKSLLLAFPFSTSGLSACSCLDTSDCVCVFGREAVCTQDNPFFVYRKCVCSRCSTGGRDRVYTLTPHRRKHAVAVVTGSVVMWSQVVS